MLRRQLPSLLPDRMEPLRARCGSVLRALPLDGTGPIRAVRGGSRVAPARVAGVRETAFPRATCAVRAANAIGLLWTLLRTSGWAVDSDIAVGMCGAPGDVDPLNDGLRVVLPGSRRVPSGKGAVAKFFGVRIRVSTGTAWVRARSVL